MRIWFIVLLAFSNTVQSYNILVYIPKFAVSHVNFMGKLADILVEAGHNVTALISEMDSSLKEGSLKAQRIIRIEAAPGADHMVKNFMVEDTDMFEINFDSYSPIVENAYHNSVSFSRQCRKLLTEEGLIETLTNHKYDAVITEAFELCGVGLSHLIKVRSLIPVSSTFAMEWNAFGLHLSMFSDQSFLSDGTNVKSFWNRLNSVKQKVLMDIFMHTQNPPLQKVFDELFPGIPSFHKILEDAAIIFTNTEPLIDMANPTLSKVIPIGGIAAGDAKPLNKEWMDILSRRPRNVLVSFGSICKSVLMKKSKKIALLRAFSRFPDTTFIWKYENVSDEFALNEISQLDNVIVKKWVPQLDLLGDSRLNLFITHGGMASCHEIAKYGVPVILVPMFGDQIHNAGMLANIGLGQVFSKYNLDNEEAIFNVIHSTLNDKRYKEAGIEISERLSNQPASPREQFITHVEFASRFGPSKALKPLNVQLSTIELYGIDIIALSLIIIFIFIYSMFILIRSVLRFIPKVRIHLRKTKTQ